MLRIVLALTIIFFLRILLASFTGCVVWVIMSNYSSLEDSCRQPVPVSMTTSCYNFWALHKRRYQRTHKCVSSKAALIILVWVFLTLFSYFLTTVSFLLYFITKSVHQVMKSTTILVHYHIASIQSLNIWQTSSLVVIKLY